MDKNIKSDTFVLNIESLQQNMSDKIKPCILAIESSCDDTSCAVSFDGKILSNVIANQEVHKNYGGVVPELASRAHLAHILPVAHEALRLAGKTLRVIDAVAFTQGPGLMGSLIVGAQFAKGLAIALNKPLIAVNHMEAHILAHFIDDPKPEFPFLNLTVSGGHTELVIMYDYFSQELVGKTIDDAAGEAFDKCGKMLGLPYPAGPHIDRLARTGNPVFKFPESKVGEFDFSFSGLKTSVLYFLRDQIKKDADFIEKNLEDLACSIQSAIVGILVRKTAEAAEKYKMTRIAISGGVSINSQLRSEVNALGKDRQMDVFIAAPQYCTDNAAMIAIAAHFKFLEKRFSDLEVSPSPRLERSY